MSFSAPAVAQESDGEILLGSQLREDLITVLANGSQEPVFTTGAAVSIFTREDIEAVQGADISRLIERAPGVTLTRNGGTGAFTGLNVRGGEADQLLVLVDGVRVADPGAPGSGFDLGTLAMGNLTKVELLRGSNSTIWGSQALAGVLAVETGAPYAPQVSLEYGSRETLHANAAGGFGAGPLEVSLGGAWQESAGFSAAAAGAEPDGYRQWEVNGRAELWLADSAYAFVQGRHADARLEIDGFPAPDFSLADTDEYQITRQSSGAAGLVYASRALNLRVAFSRAETARDNYDPAFGDAPGYQSDGTSERAELRGVLRPAEGFSLHFGGEKEWTGYEASFDVPHRTAISGAYVQGEFDRGALNLALGLRRDDHRTFGGAWSLGGDASLALGDGWRLRASYGEGFKAPSLFQLHSDYGNLALSPERSRSYEVGVDGAVGSFNLALTAYRRDTSDQIAYVSCFGESDGICTDRPFGTYDNITRTRAQGVEAEIGAWLGDVVEVGAVYALVDAADRSTGLTLARRPRHAATLSATWQIAESVRLAGDVRIVSHSYDNAANSVRLDGYEVVTLRGDWEIGDHVTLFGRVENLGGADYQTAAGYAQGGRSGHLGARASF